MFYVFRGIMKKFPGVFVVSISLSRTDLEYLIKIWMFNSPKFKRIPVEQCLPLIAILMI